MRDWTDEQTNYLKDNYGKLTYAEISQVVGRSVSAVKTRAQVLGIQRPKNRLSDVVKAQIIEMYPVTATSVLAELIGHSVVTIHHFTRKSGIKKDPEFLSQQLKAGAKRLQELGKAYRFPKGIQPFNKGTKGLTGNHPNTRRTQFKKGMKPHNHRPGIGHERITVDGYIEIKTRDGSGENYEHKQRVVWREAHGTIPVGAVICFRDGNRQNCDLSNLEMISRKQLRDRNHWKHYPPEVIEQIRMMTNFNRKLNKLIKGEELNAEEQN